jgi:5'-nucleotidase
MEFRSLAYRPVMRSTSRSPRPHTEGPLRRSRARAAALATVGLGVAIAVPLSQSSPTAARSWIVAEARLGANVDVIFAPTANPTTEVHVLGFNDFHGHLRTDTPGSLYGTPAGGSVYLAASLRAKQALYGARVATVHAGDAIGASPLVSAGFLDEPAVLSLRRMNVDFAAVGNHEFDKGTTELLRQQNGGCSPTAGCQYGTGNTTYPDGSAAYPGASGPSAGGLKPFKYLSDNVIDTTSGSPLFNVSVPDHTLTFPSTTGAGSVKVGFIGETLEATPTIVTPTGVAGLSFLDEADAANALVPQFQAAGVNSLVLVVHEGGFQAAPAVLNGCGGALIDASTGNPYPILEIARRLNPAIKVIVSGHTHAEYNCVVDRDGIPDSDPSDDLLITSASSFGRAVSDIALTIDDVTGQLVAATATNARVDRTGTGDDDGVPATLDQAKIVAQYANSISTIENRVIGEITGAMPNVGATLPTTGGAGQPPAVGGEKPAGDLIADAQLAATQAAPNSATVAFMNSGGVRDPGFTFPSSAAGEGDGKVTYGEAFTVQPFGNTLVTITLTGAQVKDVLEQQFVGCFGQTTTRILQPSLSFSYELLSDPNANGAIDAGDCGLRIYNMKVNGVALQPADSIRVTINNFLSTGGDGFTKFVGGTNRIGGAQDIDALEAYLLPSLGAGPDFAPPATTRIKAFAGQPPVVPESGLPILLPISAASVGGGVLVFLMRRRHTKPSRA